MPHGIYEKEEAGCKRYHSYYSASERQLRAPDPDGWTLVNIVESETERDKALADLKAAAKECAK